VNLNEGEDSESGEAYENIRKYLLSKYIDTDFIKKVLLNEKMNFKSKLIFI
jgi:hypothetical protein